MKHDQPLIKGFEDGGTEAGICQHFGKKPGFCFYIQKGKEIIVNKIAVRTYDDMILWIQDSDRVFKLIH